MVHLVNINEINDRNTLPTEGGAASDERAASMRGRRPRRECQFESGLVLHKTECPQLVIAGGILRLGPWSRLDTSWSRDSSIADWRHIVEEVQLVVGAWYEVAVDSKRDLWRPVAEAIWYPGDGTSALERPGCEGMLSAVEAEIPDALVLMRIPA
jgi:hypothetical protein